MYFLSNQIEVFPISVDRPSKPAARVLSENNLLNLIRSLNDYPSFVISKTYNNELFEFMIYGYYIKLEGTIDFSAIEGDNIYATIFLDTSNTSYPQLWASDSGDSFTGVVFTASPEEAEIPTLIKDTYQKYTLHILQKSGNSYTIPPESRTRFTIDEIDGGLIK